MAASVPVLFTDQRLLFPVPHRRTGNGRALNLPIVTVVGVDFQWGLEVGVYKRTFGQGKTTEPGVHWGKFVRFDKIAEGFGCHGVYVEKAEDIGPAITKALRQR